MILPDLNIHKLKRTRQPHPLSVPSDDTLFDPSTYELSGDFTVGGDSDSEGPTGDGRSLIK